jgi:hypothetical protein
MFRTGGFEYSLTPPRLDFNSVDDFLFHTRSGFCGHYASAFVTLMRAAGVPARVVTGYLGGEWNPLGHYFVLRQSDAHAWTEIWVDGRGWTRVDPTAVVAPERLTRGILDVLPDAVSGPERLLHRVPWLMALRQAWDAADAWWSTRVLGFSLQSQFALLRELGLSASGWAPLGWALAGGLAAWLGVLAWQLGRLPRSKPDRLARSYLTLCAKLARHGVPRAAHEGPLDYARGLTARRPQLASVVTPLLERYAQLRFGPASSSHARSVAAFERAVARLRLPR